MGNILSNQAEHTVSRASASGLVIRLTVTADGDGADVVGMSWIGSTIDHNGGHVVYPLIGPEQPAGMVLPPSQFQARWDTVTGVVGLEQFDATPLEPSTAVIQVLPPPN